MQIQVENLSRRHEAPMKERPRLSRAGLARERVVNQLLDLARLEESGAVQDETVDVNALVLEAVADCAAVADHKQIDLEVNFACQAVCRGAPDEARALLSSLIDNAVRYTPSFGRIDVSIGRGDGRFVVEVSTRGRRFRWAPRRAFSTGSFAPRRRRRKGRAWDCRSPAASPSGMLFASRSRTVRTAKQALSPAYPSRPQARLAAAPADGANSQLILTSHRFRQGTNTSAAGESRITRHRRETLKATTSRGVGLIGLTVIVLAVAGPAAAYTGQRLASQAKITMEQARAIALKARPGQITDEELEREGGGSGLRYSFDIRNGAVTHEVGVDARTGRVLENKTEGPHPD